MITISNDDIIRLSRGDTLQLTIFINKGNELSPERYIMTGEDKLYFALMECNQKFEDAILKKVITSDDLSGEGDPIIFITPSDTEKLENGQYYYTIKLQRIEGEDELIDTIIPNKLFYIQD